MGLHGSIVAPCSSGGFAGQGSRGPPAGKAWDKVAAGPKKDAALKHDQAAEKAQTAKQDDACNRALDAAARALV